MRRAGAAASPDALLAEPSPWRNKCARARTVDVHLGRLRAKLGPAGSRIETVFGLGYRFAENL